MEPEPRKVNDAYRREIQRAKQTPGGEKMMEGLRLFDRACKVMAEGIRRTHPYADDAEVLAIIRRRMRIVDRLENMGWYVMDDLARAHEIP
jgi:hypothetical protein